MESNLMENTGDDNNTLIPSADSSGVAPLAATPLGQEKREFKRPSEAYRDAIKSPVYKLSELMFGSLLAAYVLGFLAFAANPANTPPDLIELKNLQEINPFLYEVIRHAVARLPHLFISVTFAYVTAGAYVAYHAAILPMPHMPLAKLSTDFLLAMSQAVFFGASMMYPHTLPLWLGITLLIASLRQNSGYREVTRAFFYRLAVEPNKRDGAVEDLDNRQALKDFRQDFRGEIRKIRNFSSWKRIPWVVLFSGCILILFQVWLSLNLANLRENYLILGLTFVLAICTGVYVHLGLRNQAASLFNETITTEGDKPQTIPKSDVRFDQLIDGLEKAIKLRKGVRK